jgi:hypothetical protein
MDRNTRTASAVCVAVWVGVGRGCVPVGAIVDVIDGSGVAVAVDAVVGVNDGVGLVRVAVVPDVQPAAAVRAISAPARTDAAGFTTSL